MADKEILHPGIGQGFLQAEALLDGHQRIMTAMGNKEGRRIFHHLIDRAAKTTFFTLPAFMGLPPALYLVLTS